MISLKSASEIAVMRENGATLAAILETLCREVRPGRTTAYYDRLAEELIVAAGGRPAFKGYHGYPATINASINEEVVHGIPGERVIKEGDVVGIDVGLIYKGFHTDTAWTILVQSAKRKAQKEIEKFLKVGEETLKKVIEMARPGNRIGKISQAIQENIEGAGYSVVRVLTGHGVGRQLHEEPPIPQFFDGKIEETPEILPGMTLAIEIIYNLGMPEVILKKDGWTIVTADGKISGIFEKSIAVQKNGILVLTP